MKIHFLEDTYIRNAPNVTGDPPLGTVFKGSEIEVETDIVKGDTVQNNNGWYRDKNGWYYWSGKSRKIEPDLAGPVGQSMGGMIVTPVAPDKNSLPATASGGSELTTEKIPEGETRLVPSLEALLAIERGIHPGIKIPMPVPVLPLKDLNEPTPISNQPEPEPDGPPPPPDIHPLLWQNPVSQRLNWGVQNYLIARDWWQKRNLTGRGTTIAILSTGALPEHPDLVNITGQFQAQRGILVNDTDGLGTQAAVIAGGCGNTVFGVAPEARLLIGKVGDQDHMILPENLFAGLLWAINEKVDIIAMLVDFPELDATQTQTLQMLVNQAVGQGILLVAPVGTSENVKPESRFPAQLEGVFSVGAHDQYGQRSSFSTRSYHLDILAPGEGLLTSTPGRQTVANLKSTAIATAFIAGFLALIRQWQYNKGQVDPPAAVFGLLRDTAVARRSFNKGEDVEYGHGILNPVEVLKRLDSTYNG
jgi:major intracellular serine protease